MSVETLSSSAVGTRHVYVIDDDPAMLESTLFLLDSVGIQSTSFSDPIEFLQALKGLEPGCILTDVRMPTLTGVELHSALVKKGVGWPVILMSGQSARFEDLRLSETGIFDFIEKPFTLGRLTEALARAFSELLPAPAAAASNA